MRFDRLKRWIDVIAIDIERPRGGDLGDCGFAVVHGTKRAARAARLSLPPVQPVDYALQLFKLLSRLAELAFCG
jgi:hypothetical protein